MQATLFECRNVNDLLVGGGGEGGRGHGGWSKVGGSKTCQRPDNRGLPRG